MSRIPWNQYFMAQSHLLSLRSTCTRLMVGATIVRDKRIIAGGYNGSVTGGVHCIDEGCHIVDGHCVRTIHAEANAILQCAKFGVKTEETQLYVTHFPCLQCTKQIIQAGIKTVYYANDYRNDAYAIQLLKDSGVSFEKVPLDVFTIDPNYREKQEYVSKLLLTLKEQAPQEVWQRLEEEAEKIFKNNV